MNPLPTKRKRPSFRPHMELLEDRTVPSGFGFTDFSNPDGLSLVGDASTTTDNRLRLTPAVGGQEGGAWFTAEKQFVGLAFETTFQFQLNVDGGPPPDGSDGFAFLIQNTFPTYLAGGGGTLGYDGLRNSLAVEFDTFQNGEVNDPSPSHISVHTNGTGANGWSESLSLGSYNTNPILDNGAVYTAKIAYTPGTLSVYLDNMSTPVLTAAVDLAETLNLDAGKAWVGFTAATGGGVQNHDILNWNYTTSVDVSTTLVVQDVTVVEGSGGSVDAVFTITRTGDTTGTTTVNWATENRTAIAGSDYTFASGPVVFDPGVTQRTITVQAIGDTLVELHENFVVRLSGATGGAIADGVGIGTILNEDVTVSIGAFPPYWVGSGHYYALTSALLTWQQAEAEAVALGGHLVTINSQAEQDFLNATFFSGVPSSYRLWTGLTDQTVEGTFVWSSGEAVTYTNWFPGEPNNLTNEDFAIMGVVPGASWNDAHGTDLYYGIIELPTFTHTGSDLTVVEGDTQTAFLGAFVSATANGGLVRSSDMAYGPDGDLYVGSYQTDQVLRFDGRTGEFLGIFIDAGVGGLNTPASQGLYFSPDGKLYVLCRESAEVLLFDATTGAFLDVFIPANSGGLVGARAMTLGPDGDWYISSADTDEILRYSGTSGEFLGAFVSAGSGGLDFPRHLTFGADGNLYVSNTNTNSVLRFDGQSGEFIDVFVATNSGGLSDPGDLLFADDGYLYISSGGTNEVLRYQAQTGAFVDAFVTAGRGGLQGPNSLLLDSDNNLLVGSHAEILRYGVAYAAFTVSLTSASALPVTVDYTTAAGTASAGSDFITTTGSVTFAPGETTKTILVKTIDNTAIELDETFAVHLSNAVGATIVDGTGIGTIRDNDTKFYVVNDATTNLTYEYGANGAAGQSYALGAANTAPRGAASNAAGDTVWVVDANKTVYVYNSSGALLGSWTAGGLTAAAQIEGIATNGADIWLVDAKQDKVFKYTGAASRLSGSQNAAAVGSGSFNLNSGNKDAKGIVTDGVHLWVVNDSSTDKVFKYTLAGALVGSGWTITGGGGAPTGITLDPTSVNHLWIVDNVTDRVYQYNNAATLSSGSQAAFTSFALAAGNTNPQDIADPPVADSLWAATPLPERLAGASPTPALPGSDMTWLIDPAAWDGAFTPFGAISEPSRLEVFTASREPGALATPAAASKGAATIGTEELMKLSAADAPESDIYSSELIAALFATWSRRP